MVSLFSHYCYCEIVFQWGRGVRFGARSGMEQLCPADVSVADR